MLLYCVFSIFIDLYKHIFYNKFPLHNPDHRSATPIFDTNGRWDWEYYLRHGPLPGESRPHIRLLDLRDELMRQGADTNKLRTFDVLHQRMIDLLGKTEIQLEDAGTKKDALRSLRHHGLKEILQLIGETVLGLKY